MIISRRKHSVSVLSACLFACPCVIMYENVVNIISYKALVEIQLNL